MRFRPCIDIHNGKVKQIVGSSLRDKGDTASDNFVSEYGAEYYAKLYKSKGLYGGHVIILNRAGSEYYEADVTQAEAALNAFPNGLQIGGGINDKNAGNFINMGATHVIVTSFVFSDGEVNLSHLNSLVSKIGKNRLVLDLSCKKREDGCYYIVTDRWQKFTDVKLCPESIEMLSQYCDEFLIHAADAEGKSKGIEQGAAEIMAGSPIPCTYAGGISSIEDIELLRKIGGGRLDFTIGSALDIFGGKIKLQSIIHNS